MKYRIISIVGLLLFAMVYSYADDDSDDDNGLRMYEVTITNLTNGQPLTPPALIVHNKKFKLFELGGVARDGLKTLAKIGNPMPLLMELESDGNVFSTSAGGMLIFPGEFDTFQIMAHSKSRLSIATMLAATNDAFTGVRGVSLRFSKRRGMTVFAKVYDAGAEENDENSDNIPAFFEDPDEVMGTKTDEGFVHYHPGILGLGELPDNELVFMNHGFATIGAMKVTIRRVGGDDDD
ncbi:MAG: hypothetical protein HRT88_08110 [Lentisphaeraceae bacterium]|nr:hypothetical protein [Lentisphaeraceae bacterium]